MRRQRLFGALTILATLGAGCTATTASPPTSGTAPGPSVDIPPGWTRTLVPTFDGIATIGRLAYGSGGYVALADFSAWHSPDGLTWTSIKGVGDQPRAILPGTGTQPWIVGGWTTAGGGAAAPTPTPAPTPVSDSCPAGPTAQAQFSSSSDGATWTIGSTDPSFTGYVVGQLASDPSPSPGGAWAVGANSCAEGLPPRSMSWFSGDGRAWVAKPATAVDGLMSGVAAVGSKLVAVGASSDDARATIQGLAWTRDPAAGAWSKPAVVTGAPALGQVFAFQGSAYATDRAVEPELWTSSDLATWTKVDFPGSGPRSFAVVGGAQSPWLAAASPDGIYGLRTDGSWVRLAGATDTIEAIVATPTGLLAIAQSADGHGAIWQGPATLP